MAKNIREKIRALMEMATRSTTNEHEAANALAAAKALMEKHQIDTINDHTGSIRGEWVIGVIDRDWEMVLGNRIQCLYPVEFIVTNLGDHRAHCYVGTPDMIDVANDTLLYLIGEVNRLYKTTLPKGMSKVERSNWRRNFKNACSARMGDRIEEIQRNVKPQIAPGDGRSLVVVNENKRIKEENYRIMENMGLVVKSMHLNSYGGASIAGRIMGDAAQLQASVENGG